MAIYPHSCGPRGIFRVFQITGLYYFNSSIIVIKYTFLRPVQYTVAILFVNAITERLTFNIIFYQLYFNVSVSFEQINTKGISVDSGFEVKNKIVAFQGFVLNVKYTIAGLVLNCL